MLSHQAFIRLEVQGGAIQGTAVALNDAQYQTCPRARRKPGQRLGFTAWHVDSVGKIAGKSLAPLGQPVSQLSAETLALGVPAQQRFGDRKSVGEGKSVSVRVDRGGPRIKKKKKHKDN